MDFKAGDWFHSDGGHELWVESIRPSGEYVVLPLKPGQQAFSPLLDMMRATREDLESAVKTYGLKPGKFAPALAGTEDAGSSTETETKG